MGKLAALFVVPLDDPGTKPLEAVCSNPAVVYPLAFLWIAFKAWRHAGQE